MGAAGSQDASLFRPGHYFTGSVIVRLRAELSTLRSNDLLHASARSFAPRLADILTELGVKSARRLVTVVDLDGVLELERSAADSPLPPLRSLAGYWRIDVTHRSDDLRGIVEALAKAPEVEDAYLDIHVVPATVNPSSNP